MDNTKIVQQLRAGHRSIGTRSVNVRLAKICTSTRNSRTCEVKGRQIRPIGIRFTLSKEENETGVTSREFIDNARRDHSPITKREVVRASKNFSKRWAVRKNLRPAIERVAFQSVVVGPEQP